MWNLKQLMPGKDEDGEEGLLEEDSDGFCNLTYTQRMYAFAACLVGGLACMFLSLIVFVKPVKFAILFTSGNLLVVGRFYNFFLFGSTAFLVGPSQQINMMFDSARIYATAVYLGCVVLALICALVIHNKILTILAIICEICALIWYSLSYVPFAQRIVSDLMVRFCDTEL